MQFCQKCDNIMDISRSVPKILVDVNPSSLSNTTETQTANDNKNILKLINMFKNGIDISNEKIDYDQLIKSSDYTSLKDKEKKELTKIIKSIEDDTLSAFMICKNCSYFEKLTKRTMVLNVMSHNTSSNSELNDYSNLQNKKIVLN